MPKSFLFTNRRYIEHKNTWTNINNTKKNEGPTNDHFKMSLVAPVTSNAKSGAHNGSSGSSSNIYQEGNQLHPDVQNTYQEGNQHHPDVQNTYHQNNPLNYIVHPLSHCSPMKHYNHNLEDLFYPSQITPKNARHQQEQNNQIFQQHINNLSTSSFVEYADRVDKTSPIGRYQFNRSHHQQHHDSEDTDSDSGCSLSHDDTRLDLSPKAHCGMDCSNNFALLFEFMSPRKSDLVRRDSIDSQTSIRRALSFEDQPYVPIIEPLTPPGDASYIHDDKSDSGLGDEFACEECGKRYSTSSNLARHRQTHRSICDKKARKCPHCDKVYVSMPAYSMHVRTHSQGCECHYCGKRFSRPWLLQGHIRTHTGEKPFSCPKCSKCFADKSNLRAHIQTHSTEKPYVCGRCGKAFALKSYLYKHEESSCMRGQRSKCKQARLDAPKSHIEVNLPTDFGQSNTW